MEKTKDPSIIFLGVADHVVSTGELFPMGPIDLFQLSQRKVHFVYPSTTTQYKWVFAISKELAVPDLLTKLKIRISDEERKQSVKVSLKSINSNAYKLNEQNVSIDNNLLPIPQKFSSIIVYFKFDMVLARPGRVIVEVIYNGETTEIGEVFFEYQPVPPLTLDQIKAIKSNPHSFKAISLELWCKRCPTKLKIYTALKRQRKIEDEGNIWQHDIGDQFECECGTTKYPLRFLKESMHGMLLPSFAPNITGLNYVRRYAHSRVEGIVNEFNKKLEIEKDEKVFQEYIESHPILLAQFHAKRLFNKPSILGKFKTDFAILDTSNQLLLIELERPSLRLFKKDGHATADLMHAYGQVRDWLHEYAKYPSAVLGCLKLKPDYIVAVKGVIIGGRSSLDIFEPLQRHLSSPPYPDIAFLTFDDLSKSLLEISRKLV